MGTYSDHYPFILARCFLWCGVVGLWLVMDVWRLPKWIESLVIWTFCLSLPFSLCLWPLCSYCDGVVLRSSV